MMQVLSRSIMTYTLLCLILLQFRCIQTQDETSYAEYDSYASVNNRVISEEKDRITAGNTRCRVDHKCGRHGKMYSWCYTDDGWEPCCEGQCVKVGSKVFPTMQCYNGDTFAYCGSPGDTAADGTKCLSSHPCGTHGGSRRDYFWCYDEHKNVKYCCNPHDECSTKGYTNNWCSVNILAVDNWSYCKPKEQK